MSTAQYTTPTASIGPDTTARDGHGVSWNGGALMRTWVHPNAIRVPQSGPGSWMRFKDAAEIAAGVGTVTHVWIDTPYPQSNFAYENPYLLYSTGNDLSVRHEWPGVSNPIEPKPTGIDFNYLSDPCLVIRADGSLHAAWRFVGEGYAGHAPGGKYLESRIITGTHLGNVTVGAKQRLGNGSSGATGFTPTNAYGTWIAPSIVKHEGKWWLFVVQQFETLGNGSSPIGPIQLWESSDEGASWQKHSDPIVPEMVDGKMERLWHGSVSGPFNGWFYGVYSASEDGKAYAERSHFRVFRARHPAGPWERSDRFMWMAGEAGTISRATQYQGFIVDKDDGTMAFVGSGCADNVTPPVSDISDGWRVGWTSTVDPHATFDTPVDSVEYLIEARPLPDGDWTPLGDWSEGTPDAGETLLAVDLTALAGEDVELRVTRRVDGVQTGEAVVVPASVEAVAAPADFLAPFTAVPVAGFGGTLTEAAVFDAPFTEVPVTGWPSALMDPVELVEPLITIHRRLVFTTQIARTLEF